MGDSSKQRLAFDFLLNHYQSGSAFTKADFRVATGWSGASVGTYFSKQYRQFLEGAGGDSYRVNAAFKAFTTWDAFRSHVTQVRPLSVRQNLTLYFNQRLTPFDRYLVEGTIFGVLGKDTDCRMTDYHDHGDSAVVRLEAKNINDLIAIAEALWNRVWEQQEAQQKALVRQSSLWNSDIRDGLSRLVGLADHLELWARKHDVPEMFQDMAAEHRRKKDLALVRTWPQKLLGAAVNAARAKLGDELVDAAGDQITRLASRE